MLYIIKIPAPILAMMFLNTLLARATTVPTLLYRTPPNECTEYLCQLVYIGPYHCSTTMVVLCQDPEHPSLLD
ncbi:hypothetical protein BBOV_I001150 [Babesia bovis T2Bo]|uniref:Secreted protein n=1 Tax=Babesia bovis TaxID=5865 RepID=A7AXD5_BABBO|nr:hypothetical protein BBOV_I001150 [Babesia bovis T2Bo]EDO05208.1 hypothetical protein BBOV_I001150 [Babesia bovis T2Bo]|eukprot:XP_001608776.1 hypothetical protein [Babesia bovis T2Bo]